MTALRLLQNLTTKAKRHPLSLHWLRHPHAITSHTTNLSCIIITRQSSLDCITTISHTIPCCFSYSNSIFNSNTKSWRLPLDSRLM